jgi:hypothetical protein
VQLPFASRIRQQQILERSVQRSYRNFHPTDQLKSLQREFLTFSQRALQYAARRKLAPLHLQPDPQSGEVNIEDASFICSSFVAVCYQAAALAPKVKPCPSFEAEDWPSADNPDYQPPLKYSRYESLDAFDWEKTLTRGLLFDAESISPEELVLCLENDPENWSCLGTVNRPAAVDPAPAGPPLPRGPQPPGALPLPRPISSGLAPSFAPRSPLLPPAPIAPRAAQPPRMLPRALPPRISRPLVPSSHASLLAARKRQSS